MLIELEYNEMLLVLVLLEFTGTHHLALVLFLVAIMKFFNSFLTYGTVLGAVWLEFVR